MAGFSSYKNKLLFFVWKSIHGCSSGKGSPELKIESRLRPLYRIIQNKLKLPLYQKDYFYSIDFVSIAFDFNRRHDIQVKNRALIHDYFLSYHLNRTKEAICESYLNVNFMYEDLGCRIIFP